MDKFDKIAQETVQIVQALPFDIVNHGKGQLCKRSIWMDFCKQVDQGEAFDEEGSYAVETVRTVTAFLVEDWINELYKDGDQLRVTWCFAPLSDKYDGVDYDDVDSEIIQCEYEEIVYGKVVRAAQQARNKKGYQRTKKFDRFAFFPTFQEIFTSRDIWLVENIEETKIETVPLSPDENCRKECEQYLNVVKPEKGLKGLSQPTGDYEKLPFVIDRAIEYASKPEHYKAILDFACEFKTAKATIYDRYKPCWRMVECADPALFFDFAQQPILSYHRAERFVNHVYHTLTDVCPNRETSIAELVLCVSRRLAGDKDAVFPLLWGEPGTGKTFLIEQLADAFSAAGVKTSYIHQPMTGSVHREGNDVSMSLEGITSKWGNGRHGIIWNSIFLPEPHLVLVALDEIDKCSLHDYLVTLLDPRQPLQDAYWRDFFTKIDMKHKVHLFGTANNLEGIRKGGSSPLWSRLAAIETPPYSENEAIELVTNLVLRRPVFEVFLPESEAEKITEKIVRSYAGRQLPSIRALIDQVNRKMALREFPVLGKVLSEQREEYKPPHGIGFAAK